MPPPPVIGLAAYSGTGKTTLLERLIPLLTQAGLNIGVIKASHHRIELDQPGKDSYRLRQAGACQTLLSLPEQSICFTAPADTAAEPDLQAQLRLLNLDALDLVLVEGFREAAISKIELHRQALGKPFLFPGDPHIMAIATDHPIQTPEHLIQLDINNPQAVAHFIIRFASQAL